jgi:two-component system, OmpR family, alkaline phosphatase synthesis response regulator PhoP
MSDEADSARVALVIEDDDQIAYLLRFILTKEGYTVKVARDGRAAQALIEHEPPPAVVTLDYMLPYLNGLELLAMIRARVEWNEVPVLMLTAKSQEKDIAHALESGAAGYLIKPFKPEELRARIRSVVGDRGA